MKKLILLSMTLLTSCSAGVVEEVPTVIVPEYDYSITKDDQIKWNDLFSQKEERYLVYFYSEYCGYCKSIKQEVLSYYLLNKEKMYFLDAIKEDAVFKSPANDIIGLTSIDNFHIAGTPMIVEFIELTVTNLYVGCDNIRLYFNEE